MTPNRAKRPRPIAVAPDCIHAFLRPSPDCGRALLRLRFDCGRAPLPQSSGLPTTEFVISLSPFNLGFAMGFCYHEALRSRFLSRTFLA